DFGRAVVREVNRPGVIVDCAHSGWRTSPASALAAEKPMVASHTVAADLPEHYRGQPEAVIKAITDTGGLVGICCISRVLGGKGDIVALLDHIDYVAKKFGVDHVAIGTDVGHSSSFGVEERKKAAVSGLRRRREPFRSLWPKDDFVPG